MIRMLKELNEYGKCIREEMKATLREIKKNLQGIDIEGKAVNDLELQEEINIQPKQKEETRIQKTRIL